ncbi:DUF4440 domain-containing protein [Neorhizobium tomejilense]|uniref:nuclear transport factor 2 family protein n=1 Tax=Neorhizobium tomejilense TaxID=2093828 RepID=UPI003ECE6F54
MTTPSALADHLLGLELALQSREVRNSEEKLRELLAPEFREFGRSGRAYTFDDIVTHLVAETEPGNTSITDFSATMLSDTIALATYRGTRINDDGSRLLANRSSVWRLDPDGKWRMVFHQGTATE